MVEISPKFGTKPCLHLQYTTDITYLLLYIYHETPKKGKQLDFGGDHKKFQNMFFFFLEFLGISWNFMANNFFLQWT